MDEFCYSGNNHYDLVIGVRDLEITIETVQVVKISFEPTSVSSVGIVHTTLVFHSSCIVRIIYCLTSKF